MATILSSISGNLSKSLVLGAFVPAAFFVILGLVVITPFVPASQFSLHPLEALDPGWKVFVVSLMIVIVSILLYDLNTSLIRLYEGYPWQGTWWGCVRTEHFANELAAIENRISGMGALLTSMDDLADNEATKTHAVNAWQTMSGIDDEIRDITGVDEGARTNNRWDKVYSLVEEERTRLGLDRYDSFPDPEFVLPTRLGNRIRAFESYANRQYGIDAVVMWPRLVAELDPAFAGAVDDAKTPFDFLLNSSALSLTLGLLLLAAGLVFPSTLSPYPRVVVWIILDAVLFIFSAGSYAFSVVAAGAWGNMVKSAFDIYRWSLLAKLGYQDKPMAPDAEKGLWDQISTWMLYGNQPHFRGPDYATAPSSPTSAQGTRNGKRVDLKITKGLRAQRGLPVPLLGNEPALTVVLEVTNSGTDAVSDAVATDTVPTGFDYEWGSARCQGHARAVTGLNPYQFDLGNLPAGARRELTYRIIARPQEP